MPRKRGQHHPNEFSDLSDPQGMWAMMELYFEWLRIKNYSEKTIRHRRDYLGYFINWCACRGVVRPNEVTKPIIERYQRYLFHYRKRDGHPLSFFSQSGRIVPIRHWFKWLTRQNYILYNPASEIELPKLGFRLPKNVLTQSEAEQIINMPNVFDPIGVRDRAMLETFYSTGMRRMELVALRLYDIDEDRGTVLIRQGKGKKDRIIPIGERALSWIDRYAHRVRPSLLVGDEAGDTLFLTNRGKPFKPCGATTIVRGYVVAADIGKLGSCHMFRHTMATLMLENGADIRFIQAMLGHARLNTTAIYTQVSIKKLKEIHTATHPARMERKADGKNGQS
jgi:integrase/recombinase XerD